SSRAECGAGAAVPRAERGAEWSGAVRSDRWGKLKRPRRVLRSRGRRATGRSEGGRSAVAAGRDFYASEGGRGLIPTYLDSTTLQYLCVAIHRPGDPV